MEIRLELPRCTRGSWSNPFSNQADSISLFSAQIRGGCPLAPTAFPPLVVDLLFLVKRVRTSLPPNLGSSCLGLLGRLVLGAMILLETLCWVTLVVIVPRVEYSALAL